MVFNNCVFLNENANIDRKAIIDKYFNSEKIDISIFKNIGEMHDAIKKDIEDILKKINRDINVKQDLLAMLEEDKEYIDSYDETKSLINKGRLFKLVDCNFYWAMDGEETDQDVRCLLILKYISPIAIAVGKKYGIKIGTGDGDEGAIYPETIDSPYKDSMTIEEFKEIKNKNSEEKNMNPKEKKRGFFGIFSSRHESTIFESVSFLNDKKEKDTDHSVKDEKNNHKDSKTMSIEDKTKRNEAELMEDRRYCPIAME